MFDILKNINITITPEIENLLDNYIKEFILYNDKINLISNNDVKVLFEKHIYDSLAFNLFLQKYKQDKKLKLLDIGTGGGFPSVPLSLIFKNIDVYALDSIKKKINFIEQAKNKFEIKNIKTLCTRVEDLQPNYKSNFDIVTTRAMAELRMILEYAIPYTKVGGYFVAYKSKKADEEIINAKNALKILNTELIDTIEYSLPIEEENTRSLLVFKKIKEIPSSYPRKNGLVRKKPL